jgi:Asp-tRNA(Asn)/Glu-tRNA(Gln) amidotransferase A subunit family amidase
MKAVVLRSAVEQLNLLQKRAASPLELADEHIRQIERLNPTLNALVDFDAGRVREQARAAEGLTGALAGLPVTVKSSIAVSGHRCEVGSLIWKGRMLEEEAVVVSRLRAAGATILGTTNCPEFLMAYETDNRLHGRTSNPWSLEHSSGGSSGGESAAIAAGMAAAGLGSDSGGSVREPAHFTGICSLKPTPGRIPGRGHQPPCVGPFAILGAVGPMARTIGDVSLLFRVLSGQDPLDPVSAPAVLQSPTKEELRRIPIGYLEDDGLVPVTAETRMAVQAAVKALEAQGFKVRPYRPRSLELARKLWWTFFVRCGAMFYAPVIRGKEELLSPIFREFLSIAAADGPLSSEDLLQAWAECDLIRSKLLDEMAEFPILITPVCSVPAFRHGERSWQIDGREVGYLDAMRFTQWFNLLGAPAAVVPVGRSPIGLPIGIQIAGRPYSDEAVLGIAAAIESEFGYVAPPLS